jgi:solute:Na+ symporter, SSS family
MSLYLLLRSQTIQDGRLTRLQLSRTSQRDVLSGSHLLSEGAAWFPLFKLNWLIVGVLAIMLSGMFVSRANEASKVDAPEVPVSAPSAVSLNFKQLPSLPDALGVAAPYAGVTGGALVVACGANFPNGFPWQGGTKVWYDRVWALNQPDGAWHEVGRLPRPLAYGISVTTKEGIVCIGGSDAQRHYADSFLLSWNRHTLNTKPLPNLPVPLANAAGALLGNTVYVFGGSIEPGEKAALNRLFALNLSVAQPSWSELEPCPGKPRILAVAAVQSGAFFIVGGCALEPTAEGKVVRSYLPDTWRYTPGRGWRRMADLPHPVTAAPSPAPSIGQAHFLVLGGDDGSKAGFQPMQEHPGLSNEVLAYHTITDTWAVMGRTPAPRATVPVVEWNQWFVIPSGEVRPGVRSAEVWSLRPSSAKSGFGWINYATLAAYLGGMVLMGAKFMRRNKTTDDFFRGGQRVPWWAAGLSIFATMLSSITYIALPAQSYSVGWNLFLGNSYLLLMPLVVLVYLPFYRRLNVTTAYEYLEKRFNVATRLMASTLFMLYQLGRISIVLYLPALALATVSHFDVRSCILLMGVLCIVYTVMGGIEAVIWTDVLQAVILMGGALWALATIVSRVDGGVSEIITNASAQGRFFESVNWHWDYAVASGGVIMLGSVFTQLFAYTASQDVVQRYLTTCDEKSAARAIWFNALISPLAQAVFFAIGTALFVFYRQHPTHLDPTISTDAIFPLFIVRELPAGLAGLIVAGIFAASQSALAGGLNSVATAYVTDFHRRFKPDASDRSYLKLARWLTAAVGVIGTGMALALASFDIRSMWEAFLGVMGLVGGTVSGLFVLGIFSRRANGKGAVVGALVSGVLVFAVKQFTPAHFFIYPIVGVTSCVGLGWLASLAFPARSKDLCGLTIHTLRREVVAPAVRD